MTVFQGLKTLDVASDIAGPAATTNFTHFGADVIKVEVAEGDSLRKTVLNPDMAYCPSARSAWAVHSFG